MENRPEYIIMHHSLTADSKTVSWSAIRRFHVEQSGWRDIGYHFGIELIGDSVEVLVGRNPLEAGAHTSQEGMNRRSLGICVVGNFDAAPPLAAVWDKAVNFVASLCGLLNIPVENVKGHREYAPYKSCPGEMFSMEQFRWDVRKVLQTFAMN